jgi:hypothetical protein
VVTKKLYRRRAEATWVKTESGREVDFPVRYPDGRHGLVPVCAGPSSPGTIDRALGALDAATHEVPRTTPRSLVLTREQLAGLPDTPARAKPVHEWLLSATL